jgi:hypothetical protein
MRYYVGSAEMKWSHKDRMEQIWIQRELGDKLFEEIQQDWCESCYTPHKQSIIAGRYIQAMRYICRHRRHSSCNIICTTVFR